MTRIDIFSGFLGAGKTTLIKKLLKEAYSGEKSVLIENEFGEIGIDGGFLKEAGIEITEMNSGCICCTLVGDFTAALEKVLAEYQPDRIIIEPSGVGKLSDVILAVKKVLIPGSVELNSLVTVVDAKKCKMYMKNFGEFYQNQVEYANTIVLSRSQLQEDKALAACVELLRSMNKEAAIITTPWEEISGMKIREAMEERDILEKSLFADIYKEEHHHHHDDEDGHEHHHHEDGHEHHHHEDEHEHHHEDEDGHEHHHHEDEHEHHHHEDEDEHEHHHHEDEHEHHHGHEGHHHADEIFDSFGVESPKRYTEEQLKAKLIELGDEQKYGIVLRSKGIVPEADTDSWLHFDYVPEEMEIRRGPADYTGRLCVLGSKLNKENLDKLFA